MVKSKKMSKTSIAVIVLALLLVLSMVMGITGAWFTAHKDDGADSVLNFGTVAMTVTDNNGAGFSTARTSGSDAYEKVMPGDTLTMNIAVAKASGSDDFYYRVFITMVGEDAEHNALSLNAGDIANINSAVNQTYDTSTGAQLSQVQVVLAGQNYGNAWQGATVTVSYEVRAIQKANLTAEQATYALTTGWANAETLASFGA